MILTEAYTPERVQPQGTLLRAPLKLVLFMDFVDKVVFLPVVFRNRLYIATPGSERLTTSCYETSGFQRLWVSGENLWGDLLLLDDGVLISAGDPFKERWLSIIDYESGKVVKPLPIPKVTGLSQNAKCLFLKTFVKGVGKGSHISCFAKDSFEQKWSSGNERFSDFAVSDEYLVLKDGKGNVVCRRATDGELLWAQSPVGLGIEEQRDIEASQFKENDLIENGVLKRMRLASGEPIIFRDLVVAPMYGNRIVALDAESGALVWHKNPEYSQNITRQAYGDELYTAGGGPFIEIHDLRSGERKQLITIDKTSYREATGEDGNVWIDNFTVSETHVFATQYGPNWFFSVEKATGRVEWAFQPPKPIRPNDRPYIAEGRIYFRSLGGLYVFEGPDGYLG